MKIDPLTTLCWRATKKRFRTAQHDEDRCPVLSVRRPTVQLHASGPLSNTVRLTAHLTYESWSGLYSEHTSTVVIKCRTDRAPPRRMYHVLLAATLQAPGPAARCIVFPVVLVSVLWRCPRPQNLTVRNNNDFIAVRRTRYIAAHWHRWPVPALTFVTVLASTFFVHFLLFHNWNELEWHSITSINFLMATISAIILVCPAHIPVCTAMF